MQIFSFGQQKKEACNGRLVCHSTSETRKMSRNALGGCFFRKKIVFPDWTVVTGGLSLKPYSPRHNRTRNLFRIKHESHTLDRQGLGWKMEEFSTLQFKCFYANQKYVFPTKQTKLTAILILCKYLLSYFFTTEIKTN